MSFGPRDINRIGPSDLAINFATDVHELIRIGAIADKAGGFGMAAGAGFGVHAAWGGHWATAIAGIAIGLIGKAVAQNHKQTRYEQLHAKWQGILSGLSEPQVRAFVEEIATCYPNIVYAFRSGVLGNASSQRFIGLL